MKALTRKEKILDGQDLTPLTRKEYFMKKAVSGGGEGGGGGFPVELIIESNTDTVRSSKTSLEIISAFNSGLLPYLFYVIGDDAPTCICPFVAIDDNLAHFRLITSTVSDNTITDLSSEEYIVHPDGNVDVIVGSKSF